MGNLDPVAFDIETSGLDDDAVITVAGFSHQLRSWVVLNTGGRNADQDTLEPELTDHVQGTTLTVVTDEADLLEEVARFVDSTLDSDEHYLTAYNGERWRSGFDLPFLRTRCLRHDVAWPFSGFAYADAMDAVERFDTGDVSDLVGVYDLLIGEESCDPFDDSAAAVRAYEDADWLPLLEHNLADIERTRELAELAERYVPSSDFSMKNLAPPNSRTSPPS